MDTGALIWSLLVLLLGSFLLTYFSMVQIRSKQWSIVIGMITDSKIEEGKDSETNSTIYMITISLSYKFGNDTFSQKHKNAVYQSSIFSQALAKLSDYPIGRQMMIWCNPKKPKQYMLKEDITGSKAALWAGLVFIGIGVLIACVGR